MLFAIGIVVLSGFFHALWNVCSKKSFNKEAFLFSIQLISFTVFSPIVLPKLIGGDFSDRALSLFLASAIIHGIYFVLLARLYTKVDLSQSYPIIRGSSLFIIPLFGVIFLNENISIIGWIGIAIIVSGIFFISEIKLFRLNYTKLLLSLCVGLLIALYIVVDKLALQYTDPVTLNQIGTLGNLLFLLPIIFQNKFRNFKKEWRVNFKLILIGAFLAPCSYMLFLWAAGMEQISVLAPIREIGVVFGAIIGVLFLKEQNGRNRVLASVIITFGMLLLGLFH